MPDPAPSSPQPKFSADTIVERLKVVSSSIELAVAFARELDWLGDAASHPEGSEQRTLSGVRDKIDFALSRVFLDASIAERQRAETTHCMDLIAFAHIHARGDGQTALHLMRREHQLFGDGSDADGEVSPETFPDSFAWDTYLRVSYLTALVEKYPKHLRHCARQMHGWPMIVSHHLDCTPEFKRVAELLEVGADYPLAVCPRKKRGTETPLLRYLEPQV